MWSRRPVLGGRRGRCTDARPAIVGLPSLVAVGSPGEPEVVRRDTCARTGRSDRCPPDLILLSSASAPARRPGCTGSCSSTACATARRCSCPTTRVSSTDRGTSSPTPRPRDPRYIVRLAVEGGFNGIAIQIGLAEKFYWDYAGEVPLILKLNGKTDIPPDASALSPVHASVEDAVRLGADAVGYTLYVGTPAQEAGLRAATAGPRGRRTASACR